MEIIKIRNVKLFAHNVEGKYDSTLYTDTPYITINFEDLPSEQKELLSKQTHKMFGTPLIRFLIEKPLDHTTLQLISYSLRAGDIISLVVARTETNDFRVIAVKQIIPYMYDTSNWLEELKPITTTQLQKLFDKGQSQ